MANNTDNPQILQDNWANNLLIKDKSGQLKSLNEKEVVNLGANEDTLASRIAAPTSIPTDDNFVDLSPVGASHDKANFGFHPEDEQEVKNLVDKLPQDNSKKYSIEKIVDKLIEKDNLRLTPEDKKRFTDIIFDFFRHRRNAITVRELLSERILSNNEVLSEDEVNNIVSVVKTIKLKIDSSGGLVVKVSDLPQKPKPDKVEFREPAVVSSLDKPEVADLEKDLNAQIKEDTSSEDVVKTQAEIKGILSDLKKDFGETTKPIQLEPQKKKESAKVEISSPIVEPEENPAKIESLPKVFRQSKSTSSKKTIADVVTKVVMPVISPRAKSNTALTGPVEELQSLTLATFRRLGNSPTEQADKLLEKINLLERDSVTKKTQGIEAWRNSEVYSLYLELGEASLNQSKNMADIIQDHESQGKKTLNLEEFSAISDLNKHLRF